MASDSGLLVSESPLSSGLSKAEKPTTTDIAKKARRLRKRRNTSASTFRKTPRKVSEADFDALDAEFEAYAARIWGEFDRLAGSTRRTVVDAARVAVGRR